MLHDIRLMTSGARQQDGDDDDSIRTGCWKSGRDLFNTRQSTGQQQLWKVYSSVQDGVLGNVLLALTMCTLWRNAGSALFQQAI